MARIWSIRFRRRLALPIMGSTVTVIAMLISQTSQEPIDAMPPNSIAEGRTTGNPAVGGRPVQVCFSLVRRVVPPPPAVDTRYNWPPIRGVTLRIRVGVITDDGRPRVDPAAGYASARTGVTSADGIIQVDYIPPARSEAVKGAAGTPVAIWFEDRDRRIAASEVRLWNRQPIGIKRPHRIAGAPPQPERWMMSNQIQEEPFSSYVERAADSWNQALTRSGAAGLQSVLSHETTQSCRANLTVEAGYPKRPDERVRRSFGVTEISLTGRARVGLHLEYLNPERRFRPFVPGAVTGLENIGRTFEPTLPLDAVFGTMTHELGHVLGLDDTVDAEAQASVMSLGRDGLIGNNFRFFVNGVNVPTTDDALAALEIGGAGTRSPDSPGSEPSDLPPSAATATLDGTAIQPPMSSGVRFQPGPSMFRAITHAAVRAVTTTTPVGVPPWNGTAWSSGDSLEFSVWPEFDRVRIEEGPRAAECFHVPGLGRQVLRSPAAGTMLAHNPILNRRLLLVVCQASNEG